MNFEGRRLEDIRKGRQKDKVAESDRKKETTSSEPPEEGNTIF